MDELRKSFEALGFEQVKTYIQSGNVVFKARKAAPISLKKRIEQQILTDFGFSVSVISRTVEEMSKTIEGNPFLKQPGIDSSKLHVVFLSDAPVAAAIRKLEALTALPERSCCCGRELYLYLPNRVSDSPLMKTPLDRLLAVVTTTRNWNTVTSLHRICQDCS